MKKVTFNHLKIENFKGIKFLQVDFSELTTISGENATGKSTIFDAILWCLFGKNSQDAKNFSIKNTSDRSLNRADHVVELLMTVNDEGITAKRIFKEKWTKRRGSEETEFTGHETLFFWNDVPLSAEDYQAKVSEIIPEQLFKQITNPIYFNVQMKWQERREMLIRMAGDITDEKIINGSEAFQILFAQIKGKKSLEEFKKELAYERAALKKQLLDIPARIDELIKSNPNIDDWKAIESEIASKIESLKNLDKEIENILGSFDKEMTGIKAKQQEAIAASRKMGEIENELTKKSYAEAAEANKSIIDSKYLLSELRRELKSQQNQEKEYNAKLEFLNTEIQRYRDLFVTENAKEFSFDREACVCPTCKRALEIETIEEKELELFNHFKEEKQKNLNQIRTTGHKFGEDIKNAQLNLNDITSSIKSLKEREQSFIWAEEAVPALPKKVDLLANPQYQSCKAISEQIFEVKQPDISEQKEMKVQIQEGIDELKTRLNGKAQIEKNAIRIEEMKKEEKNYSQQLADLEKQEFVIEAFYKTKMTAIESSINSKFKYVKFKLFETQINGGEAPCCEVTYHDVPFLDLNHAAQINAGVDCINALSTHYGVSAPLVIDNSEAINQIIPVSSQLIKLRVTIDKELVVINN